MELGIEDKGIGKRQRRNGTAMSASDTGAAMLLYWDGLEARHEIVTGEAHDEPDVRSAQARRAQRRNEAPASQADGEMNNQELSSSVRQLSHEWAQADAWPNTLAEVAPCTTTVVTGMGTLIGSVAGTTSEMQRDIEANDAASKKACDEPMLAFNNRAQGHIDRSLKELCDQAKDDFIKVDGAVQALDGRATQVARALQAAEYGERESCGGVGPVQNPSG